MSRDAVLRAAHTRPSQRAAMDRRRAGESHCDRGRWGGTSDSCAAPAAPTPPESSWLRKAVARDRSCATTSFPHPRRPPRSGPAARGAWRPTPSGPGASRLLEAALDPVHGSVHRLILARPTLIEGRHPGAPLGVIADSRSIRDRWRDRHSPCDRSQTARRDPGSCARRATASHSSDRSAQMVTAAQPAAARAPVPAPARARAAR